MIAVYDIETYPNCFLVTLKLLGLVNGPSDCFVYEISDRKDNSQLLRDRLVQLRGLGWALVGFNNLNFDYPVLHTFLNSYNPGPQVMYEKAQAIIEWGNSDKEGFSPHTIWQKDWFIEQIDLFKIHHFDNKARATSLKVLEFNMRSPWIQDLPFEVGKVLTSKEIDVLIEYNIHDVEETTKFYEASKDMIMLRGRLTQQLGRNFMNHNDTKIGKDFFVMELEKAGIPCYTKADNGRKPIQTPRSSMKMSDILLSKIEFRDPIRANILKDMKTEVLAKTKGGFTVEMPFPGIVLDIGTGGIHGSVKKQIIEATDDTLILDLDVTSFYPNLSIHNQFYPEHLTSKFCDIYRDLYEKRKVVDKKSFENKVYKLALNGVYGDTNQPHSPFYDPLCTMKITMNGQLFLCMLIEVLTEIDGVQLIQANTDGITIRVAITSLPKVVARSAQWSEFTSLTLESSFYSKMIIRDVNSYLAVTTDGKVKRKGAFVYQGADGADPEWHKDHSALIVPKVIEKVLLEGAPIRETVERWPDFYDFCLRTRVPRKGFLTFEHDGKTERLQNVTRYVVTVDGGYLKKHLPFKDDPANWSITSYVSGYKATPCNDLRQGGEFAIDYSWYIKKVEDIVLRLK